MAELVRDMKYYAYYLEAYEAVLGGFVGEYEIQKKGEDGKTEWEKCYGLKAFSPIAKGFEFRPYIGQQLYPVYMHNIFIRLGFFISLHIPLIGFAQRFIRNIKIHPFDIFFLPDRANLRKL